MIKSTLAKNGSIETTEINKTDDEQVISRAKTRNNRKSALPPAPDGGSLWTSCDLQVGCNDPIPGESSRPNKTTERAMDKVCRTRLDQPGGVPNKAPTPTSNRSGEERRRSPSRRSPPTAE